MHSTHDEKKIEEEELNNIRLRCEKMKFLCMWCIHVNVLKIAKFCDETQRIHNQL